MESELKNIRNFAKVSHLARLFQILTEVYRIPKNITKLKKLEGAEILAVFPKLENTCATLKIMNCHYHPTMKKTENPLITIIFNLNREEIVPIINEVIRTKANCLGILKLAIKYLVPGKIKFKGPISKAIIVLKTLMIGEHEIYKLEKSMNARIKFG